MRALVVVTVLASATASAQPDLSVFYGSQRATLGAGFGKLALGQAIDAPALPASPGVQVLLDKSGKRIDGVEIGFPATACSELESKLVQLWGPPKDGAWIASTGTQGTRFRADFDVPCWLSFYRRVSPPQIVSWSRQSVIPLWALGKPVTALEAALADLQPKHEYLDGALVWSDVVLDGARITVSISIAATMNACGLVPTTFATASTRVFS
jgi:hypothetical protein